MTTSNARSFSVDTILLAHTPKGEVQQFGITTAGHETAEGALQAAIAHLKKELELIYEAKAAWMKEAANPLRGLPGYDEHGTGRMGMDFGTPLAESRGAHASGLINDPLPMKSMPLPMKDLPLPRRERGANFRTKTLSGLPPTVSRIDERHLEYIKRGDALKAYDAATSAMIEADHQKVALPEVETAEHFDKAHYGEPEAEFSPPVGGLDTDTQKVELPETEDDRG